MPSNFWEKLNHLPAVRQPLGRDLKRALEKTLPDRGIEYKVVAGGKSGLGSLGQERFVAIAKWEGGCIAREAKLMVPSACSWLNDNVEKGQPWIRIGEVHSFRGRVSYFKQLFGRQAGRLSGISSARLCA